MTAKISKLKASRDAIDAQIEDLRKLFVEEVVEKYKIHVLENLVGKFSSESVFDDELIVNVLLNHYGIEPDEQNTLEIAKKIFEDRTTETLNEKWGYVIIRSKRNGRILENSNVVIGMSLLNDTGKKALEVVRFLKEEMEMGTNEAFVFIHNASYGNQLNATTFGVYRGNKDSRYFFHNVLNSARLNTLKMNLRTHFKDISKSKKDKMNSLI